MQVQSFMLTLFSEYISFVEIEGKFLHDFHLKSEASNIDIVSIKPSPESAYVGFNKLQEEVTIFDHTGVDSLGPGPAHTFRIEASTRVILNETQQ